MIYMYSWGAREGKAILMMRVFDNNKWSSNFVDDKLP